MFKVNPLKLISAKTLASGITPGLTGWQKQFLNLLGGLNYKTKVISAKPHKLKLDLAPPGTPIPLIYGKVEVEGQIIWASQVREQLTSTIHRTRNWLGVTIGKTKAQELEYYVDIAVLLVQGPIKTLDELKLDDRNPGALTYRFYDGTQIEADPLLTRSYGEDNVPAWRDKAYLVIENIPLHEYNYRLPKVSATLTATPKCEPLLGEQLENMVLIPGSGEFVYETEIVHNQRVSAVGSKYYPIGTGEYANSHHSGAVGKKSNAVVALDQMQQTCPNLQWVSPVVNWFATSNNLEDCQILPGVEHQFDVATKPYNWQVANKNRYTAYLISGGDNGAPTYGGTPADQSVLNMLAELKKRQYKVMFYPMFLMDTESKPWRGRLTGAPEQVANFFHKRGGYREFILHYAQLVKGQVDAFLIGSELIGLTNITSEDGTFPVVNELISLAREVRKIMGPDVKLSYAADWSEYHHSKDGYHHLDPLWALPEIDFVGIDAYFPLTRTSNLAEAIKDLPNAWKEGEGYDYYYDEEGKKLPLSPAQAWKNLEYWWSNTHINPDGKATAWIPKSKQIWFTECGFPAVNGSSNQPNLFYDPNSSESGLPKHSTGAVDFAWQYQAIKATTEYWQNSDMVQKIFWWTWDARPFPTWPACSDIWRDGDCWQRGHWLNGKISLLPLRNILYDLMLKAGFTPEQITVKGGYQLIEGIKFDGNLYSASEAMAELRKKFGVKFSEAGNKVIITVQDGYNPITIPQQKVMQAQYMAEKDLHPALSATHSTRFEYSLGLGQAEISTPPSGEILKLSLMPSAPLLLPGQSFTLEGSAQLWQAVQTRLGQNYAIEITARQCTNLALLAQDTNPISKGSTTTEVNHNIEFEWLRVRGKNILHVAPQASGSVGRRLKLYAGSESQELLVPATPVRGRTIAKLASFPIGAVSTSHSLEVTLTSGELTSPEPGILHYALVGTEVIGFTHVQASRPHHYRIKGIIRDICGMADYTVNLPEVEAGAKFTLLDNWQAVDGNLQQEEGSLAFELYDQGNNLLNQGTWVVNHQEALLPVVQQMFSWFDGKAWQLHFSVPSYCINGSKPGYLKPNLKLEITAIANGAVVRQEICEQTKAQLALPKDVRTRETNVLVRLKSPELNSEVRSFKIIGQ